MGYTELGWETMVWEEINRRDVLSELPSVVKPREGGLGTALHYVLIFVSF